jgi:hypothetical protein
MTFPQLRCDLSVARYRRHSPVDAQCATTPRPQNDCQTRPQTGGRSGRHDFDAYIAAAEMPFRLAASPLTGSSSLTSSITLGILPGMAASQDEKVRENRLRRMADRQGLKLTRSRRRDPLALDYGLYWLTEISSNTMLTPEQGVSIDEIEDRLTRPPALPTDTSPPTG